MNVTPGVEMNVNPGVGWEPLRVGLRGRWALARAHLRTGSAGLRCLAAGDLVDTGKAADHSWGFSSIVT